MKLPLPLALLSLLCFLNANAPAATADQEKQLEHDWDAIGKAGDNLGPRQLIGFILEATPLQWHAERVDDAMSKLEELQDREPGSATYGNFRWYKWQPKPVDLNAAEFTMQQATLLWNLHRDQLSPQSRDRLARLIKLSIEGINHHKVPVEYTNIFVMKTWNSIAIGEAFQRPDVAERGYAMLREWMEEIRLHGVHEYLSPTYTGTDLDSLALLARFAGRTQDREAAQKALEFLYWECRANWFAPDERLGGSHSRDYDYLTGHGYLDRYLADWGWITGFKHPALHTFADLTAWKPSDTTSHPETTVLPRFTWQRWGAQPEQHATQYIGSTISIGADASDYGMEDKVFTINFDGGPKMVMANFFMDGRGDPYGQNKVQGKDGHSKAHHLAPFVASAQDGPDLLFFSSHGGPPLPGAHPEAPLACLNSHLDLPAEAAVWQGDKELAVHSGDHSPLAPDQPVFLRYKQSAVAFHFEATDDSGKPLAPIYYRDGDALRAARISWTHSAGAPKGEAHVIFWAKVAENLDDDAFAKFRADFAHATADLHFEGGKLTAHVEPHPGATLALEASLAAHSSKSIPANPSGIFEVNGKELGQLILSGSSIELGQN